jgi:AcrR family transcriptional regulator
VWKDDMTQRPGLSRDAIVDAAARVADRGGLPAVSMRGVGKELGVEAMSLYHHVAGKAELLDGLADWVFAQIRLPNPAERWRPAMTQRAVSARSVLAAHPWALPLIESRRRPGPALLRHHDSVLGFLRRGGFSVDLAAQAFSVIDAYVYGFVLTEVTLPFDAGETAEAFVGDIDLPADTYPYLTEMMREMVIGADYAYGNEFDRGLDLILDQLADRIHGRR